MAVASPDDRCIGRAESRKIANRINDVLDGDVSEDSTKEDEISWDSTRINVGNRSVAADDLDSVETCCMCGSAREPHIVCLKLDQARCHVRPVRMPSESPD